MTSQTLPGAHLTCTNPACSAELMVVQPCPHGDTYRCACGSDFEASAPSLKPDTGPT
jgi:hypothetical protein